MIYRTDCLKSLRRGYEKLSCLATEFQIAPRWKSINVNMACPQKHMPLRMNRLNVLYFFFDWLWFKTVFVNRVYFKVLSKPLNDSYFRVISSTPILNRFSVILQLNILNSILISKGTFRIVVSIHEKTTNLFGCHNNVQQQLFQKEIS